MSDIENIKEFFEKTNEILSDYWRIKAKYEVLTALVKCNREKYEKDVYSVKIREFLDALDGGQADGWVDKTSQGDND